MKNWKRKVGAAVLAGALLGGVGSSAAYAKPPTTGYPGFRVGYDCFPGDCNDNGYYTASGNKADFKDQPDGNSGWGIKYDEDVDDITVSGRLRDNIADGDGATAQFAFEYRRAQNNDYIRTDYHEERELRGAGYTRTFTWVNNDVPYGLTHKTKVSVRICAGKSSSGANENCGAWHGPFALN